MLEFGNCVINYAMLNSVSGEAETTPVQVTLNDYVEELIFSSLKKNFGKTKKWYVPDTKKPSDFIENISTMFTEDGSDPILVGMMNKLTDVMIEHSDITNRQGGELLVLHLSGVQYFEYNTDALLVLRVGSKEPRLKITSTPLEVAHNFVVSEKMSLAALFIAADNDFKVASIDKITKKGDRSAWNDLLCLTEDKDDYFHTCTRMNQINEFITNAHVSCGWNVVEKSLRKRRIFNYFKDAPEFDYSGFESLILDNQQERIKFNEHSAKYQVDYRVELPDDFTIEKSAVKEMARLFKGTIQLDSYFKVDIDGGSQYIERGFDEKSGKKFIRMMYDFENAV